MAKKKSKKTQFTLKPWCWYCEREFEDEKVLLQHQKAKHFKCRHCPRKLNTAGGLMVHCQQVHKTEPDKLENTLPGRDGYDVEIFGMEGVPAKDKDEWKAKKEAEFGVNLNQQQNPNKRPKIYHGVISENDLKLALEQHKMLMSGGKLGSLPGMPMGGLPGMPPPSMIPAGPPMFMPPPGMAPPFPPFPGAPMPPFPGAGMPGNLPFPPPPGFRPPFPPMGMPGMPSPIGVPPFGPPGGMMGSPASAMAAPSALGSVVTVMPAQNGVIWPDADASPAEKRAQQPQYRHSSPALSSAPLPYPDQGHQPPAFAQTSGIPSASGAAPSASNLQDKYATTPIPEAPTGVPGPHSTLTSLDGSGVQPGETVNVENDVTASLKRKAEDDVPVA